ncbi:hypothetical protein BS50DRAFT_673458 [Corynespora cassiicola Philippines]|uniref:Altered inheritance of mitochondria protein 32 n=1 Tax=Corynespora cassiicola Philippines TaxID=1448308 RepID=A0A2T2NZ32_CORCC|nr:hypothetical protein BS50DRAFT_673458 [Corynespora cassiicola Philippines]
MSFLRLRPARIPIRALRSFATTSARRQSPIPYVQSCPAPTCTCAPAPEGLDIDRKTPLMNTMAAYTEQVLVSTGKPDWTSRIEDEESDAGAFVRGLKGVIGKGGKAFDPFTNTMLTASSLPASPTPNATSILLFPSFLSLPSLPNTPATYDALASVYLKAKTLHPYHASLPDPQKAALTRDPSAAAALPAPIPISHPVVLICGHGGRDQRCGILGPVLKEGFERELARRGIEGEVGVISHIGGHKYAGNVIVYVPPGYKAEAGENALQGSGVWYGRVGPEHVEGIVGETLGRGRVVLDLFRGGIAKGGVNLGRVLEGQVKKDRGEADEGLKLKPKARR